MRTMISVFAACCVMLAVGTVQAQFQQIHDPVNYPPSIGASAYSATDQPARAPTTHYPTGRYIDGSVTVYPSGGGSRSIYHAPEPPTHYLTQGELFKLNMELQKDYEMRVKAERDSHLRPTPPVHLEQKQKPKRTVVGKGYSTVGVSKAKSSGKHPYVNPMTKK